MDKLVVTAAVTGSLITRDQNPCLPVTPAEIAQAAIDSRRAGAAMAHLHVRDPKTGRPVQDPALFEEVIERIRAQSDILINVSTGGGPGMSFDERIGIIPALAGKPGRKPDVASLNAGSLNFGILSARRREFVLDAVQLNPWSQLKRFAETMTSYGVKPEIEIYEAGMLHNARVLADIGALEHPLHFQFVLGVLGGLQPTVENLVFLKTSMTPGASWSVCATGLDIFTIGPVAVAMGGHVRVGLEDTVYVTLNKKAESNAELVEKIIAIARSMGREPAEPEEARHLLNLPKQLQPGVKP
jgi:3-keto-5-aminohexanoate cleavage enzyme